MTTHSSILARKSPWTEETGGSLEEPHVVHGVPKSLTDVPEHIAHTPAPGSRTGLGTLEHSTVFLV